MSIFDDEEVMTEKLRCSAHIIKNVIVGYRETSAVCLPLVIILPEIYYFNSRKNGETIGYNKAGIALYPNSENFRYDKGGYLASLISLASGPLNTLAFIHAERIDTSECREDWENLILNLMAHNQIKISDDVIITRPESDLTVLVCTEIPTFLRGGSIKFRCIDLTDKNLKKSEAIKKYDGYAFEGEQSIEAHNPSEGYKNSNNPTEEPGNPNMNSNNERPTVNKEIDWEERRFQLVKAIVAGKLAGKDVYDVSLNEAHINKIIGIANRIINKLKNASII